MGSHVVEVLQARGHDVVVASRSCRGEGRIAIDLRDTPALMGLLEATRPQWVIHAAGWTWVDGCERDPDRSLLENTEIPSLVARWCADNGARLAYFSSSYVFDGEAGDYSEDAPTAPINAYGRHKALAEARITEISAGTALILRLICVWGRELAGKNFLCQVLRCAETGIPLTVPADQRGNPTWAGDIGRWTVALCEAGDSGIWHLAGRHPSLTRAEWAERILAVLDAHARRAGFRLEARPTRELGQDAARPLRAGMRTDKVMSRHPLTPREPGQLDGVVFAP